MDKQKLLQIGADTIRKEGETLLRMASNLDDNFLKVLEIFLEPDRKIVVCGMGKSGHIGKKIAATLASTGTPAFFVHPAEACHGDLGMIGDKDALLAISNSGASRELIPVLQFAQRHSIPVIAITHEANSLLGKNADITLLLDYPEEACPLGCAPTTSTTATLALGDALAMALLTARGFSLQDFNEFHPGGSLGLRLVSVGKIMHTGSDLPLVGRNASIAEVLMEITIKGFGCTGVEDENKNLIGIITDGDLRRHQNNNGSIQGNAEDLMTASPQIVNADCPVSKALGLMNRFGITCLFITENSLPKGIVHMHDCLKLKV